MERNLGTRNLSDKVREYIREKIFLGEYESGGRILEQELADELNISRAPVREAIKDLVNQGLLTSISNKGTFVVEFTESDVKEIFDIRIYLECRVIESLLADDVLNKRDFNKLQEIVDEMAIIARRESSYREKLISFTKKDIEFHRYLWNRSGKKWTVRMLSNLYYQLQIAMMIDSELQEDLNENVENHRNFLYHLREKNKEETFKILKNHMMLAGRDEEFNLRDIYVS